MTRVIRFIVTLLSVAVVAGWFGWLGGGSAQVMAAQPLIAEALLFYWLMQITAVREQHKFAYQEHAERIRRAAEAEERLAIIPRLYEYHPELVVELNPAERSHYQYLEEVAWFEKYGISEERIQQLAIRLMHKRELFSVRHFTPHWRGFTSTEYINLRKVFVEKGLIQKSPERVRVKFTDRGNNLLNRFANRGIEKGVL